MQRLPQRSTSSGHPRRRATALALIVGFFGAATVLTSGSAAAALDDRPGRDTSGAHHVDPEGIHHTDNNPLRQNEHQQAQREYWAKQQSAPTPGRGGGGESTTWTAVPRPDGEGWVVCKPTAARC
ncbi:hypothetical protein F5X71_30910 [Nocardia brasiliensis]|uniref:Uncharacterized protein n=1 Tax=Nocardia brasiliensis TaxID=37326 RepID=A0A6G9XYY4_NOCBR|nr:hypothetical protein [Nocardia brasiliensis]QIS06134.1 hypothetical protein F5X71_30910 [Nocardia brasiliensis]